MNNLTFLRNIILLFIMLQIVAFIIVKQKFTELERRSMKLEGEINAKINNNNILKIQLTSKQNDYRIKKLGEKYLPEYKSFKPNQIIEMQNI